jgi:hypothetical protein
MLDLEPHGKFIMLGTQMRTMVERFGMLEKEAATPPHDLATKESPTGLSATSEIMYFFFHKAADTFSNVTPGVPSKAIYGSIIIKYIG